MNKSTFEDPSLCFRCNARMDGLDIFAVMDYIISITSLPVSGHFGGFLKMIGRRFPKAGFSFF